MKKYIFLIVFVLASFSAKAQFTISYSAGYGTYEMDDMKKLMSNGFTGLNSKIPNIPFSLVSNFPGYVTHRADLSYLIGQQEFGVTGSFLTTGGKIAYSDYSGEYIEKLTTNGIRIGALYRYYMPVGDIGSDGVISLYGELSPAAVFTKLKYKGHATIGGQTQDFTDEMGGNAVGISIQPMLGVKLNVTRNIGFHLAAGYDFSLLSNMKKETMVNSTKIVYDLKMDWSGFRANAGVSYTFGQ